MPKDDRDARWWEAGEIHEQGATPSSPDCGFCGGLRHPGNGRDSAPAAGDTHFMTDREFRVLAAMRRLKEEIRAIRSHPWEGEGGEGQDAGRSYGKTLERLAHLRAEWKRMDRERIEAAEERMRLLGHIP